MNEVPGDPAEIDGAWLTEALDAAGVARGATVADVEVLGDIGTGQTGRSTRLGLTWDDPTGRPTTVVGKFPSLSAEASASAFANGTYLKEWTFYNQVRETVDVRAPHCYTARYDETKPSFVILMEDLSGSQQGDQLEGLDADQIDLAISQAVALHAPRFGDPKLETLLTHGQPVPSQDEIEALGRGFYDLTLPGFLDRLGDRVDADIVELAEQFSALIGVWMRGTETPNTIVHHDFRADNLMFGTSAEAPPIVVVDWQTLNIGGGGADIAYLISGSYPDPDDRRSVERDFVETYRGQMAARGIDMTADQCWRDYRHGSLWGMFITVVATVLAQQTVRGDDMLTAMAQRHGRQALDLDALGLLRS